jgi:PP-loop superfamily ATP-utilizing enzyme
MASTSYQEIRDSMRQLYLDDPRPWLVGFSGGKDSTMVASLVFDAVLLDLHRGRTRHSQRRLARQRRRTFPQRYVCFPDRFGCRAKVRAKYPR